MGISLRALIRHCEYWQSIGLPKCILDNSDNRSEAEELLLDLRYFSSLIDILDNTMRNGASLASIEKSPIFLAIEQKMAYIEELLDKVKMNEEPLRPRNLRGTLQLLLAGDHTHRTKAPFADTKRNREIADDVDQVIEEFAPILKDQITRNYPLLLQRFAQNPEMFLAHAIAIDRATVLSNCSELNGRDMERACAIVGLCRRLKPGTVRKIYESCRRSREE